MAKKTIEQQEMPFFLGKAIAEKVRKTAHDVKEGWDNLRIGEGHFMAWIREGFKELTHMLLPAFPQGQFIIEEPGLWGNPTQGEVADNRDPDEKAMSAAAIRTRELNQEPVRRDRAVISAEAPAAAGRSGQEAPSRDIVEQARAAGQDAPGPDTGRDQSIERER